MRENNINRKLIITQHAKDDLQNITEYYQHVDQNYIRKILVRLENAMILLLDFPEMGKDIGFARRLFFIEGYVIVYVFEADIVSIQTVLPQKADYKRYI